MKCVLIVNALRVSRWSRSQPLRRSGWRRGRRWRSAHRRRVRRAWCVGWIRRRCGCRRKLCRCGQRHDSRAGWSGRLTCEVGQGKACHAPEDQQHRESEYSHDDPSILRHVGLPCRALSRMGYDVSVGRRSRGIEVSRLYHRWENGATRVLANDKRPRRSGVGCISRLQQPWNLVAGSQGECSISASHWQCKSRMSPKG